MGFILRTLSYTVKLYIEYTGLNYIVNSYVLYTLAKGVCKKHKVHKSSQFKSSSQRRAYKTGSWVAVGLELIPITPALEKS